MAKNIVIVGAVALGSKAACRVKRLMPDANVTLIDKDEFISYGGCGIPYYVSGDVSDETELRSTSFHMLRDAKFFKDVKGVDVLTRTTVVGIDREAHQVLVENANGEQRRLDYDNLVLGIGSRPRKLDIPGKELANIYTATNLHDAIAIKAKITKGEVEKAVIVGGGFIGLEMAEALTDLWGIETTVVEFCDQIMPGFVSKSFAKMAQAHMAEKDVTIRLSEKVEAFLGADGKVNAVKTDKATLPAELVIMATGIEPATELAREAGLEVGPMGAIVVNDRMQTSDPDIYTGGDCAQVKNLITGKSGFYPLGSLANRQGRVIGTNLAGGDARFKGAVGSFVVKIFETSLAGAGLTLDRARMEGFDAISVQICQFDRAHFYPEKDLMYLELVVEKGTRRVLGIQGFGSYGDAMVGRINAVAGMLQYNITVDDISNLELAYSPPFASAMDVLNALANTADNALSGQLVSIESADFAEHWKERKGGNNGVCFLDCRALQDARPYLDAHPDDWKSIPQDQLKQRLDEVPKDKKLVLICNTGVRSYEAQLNLREAGLDNTCSVQGGMAAVKKWGLDILSEPESE